MKTRCILLILFLCIHFLLHSFDYPVEIKEFLTNYKRPFTLLEIQPGKNPFSFELAQEFDCTCVVLENASCRHLLDYCQAKQPHKVILLARHLELYEYQVLSQCEHFDVVMIPDAHALFTDDISTTCPILLALGDYTLIKIPQSQEAYKKKFLNYLYQNKITFHQNETDLHDVWVFVDHPRTSLIRKSWYAVPECNSMYTIQSSFEKKQLVHKYKVQPSDWICGINLVTFIVLQGQYPRNDWIYKKILEFKNVKHNDFWIGNMIMQGQTISLIDFNDARKRSHFKTELARTLHCFNRKQKMP